MIGNIFTGVKFQPHYLQILFDYPYFMKKFVNLEGKKLGVHKEASIA
jgi:hypothetical protein